MNGMHAINRETAEAVYTSLCNAIGETEGSDEVDGRDAFAGVAEFVAMFIRFLEDRGLGDRFEWIETMRDMLVDLLDDGGPE